MVVDWGQDERRTDGGNNAISTADLRQRRTVARRVLARGNESIWSVSPAICERHQGRQCVATGKHRENRAGSRWTGPAIRWSFCGNEGTTRGILPGGGGNDRRSGGDGCEDPGRA